MNKLFIALGIALASSTAALADSSALDVLDRQAVYFTPAIDAEATASIGESTNYGVEALQNRARLGDGSPMVSGELFGTIAIETGYLPAQRLGGNS